MYYILATLRPLRVVSAQLWVEFRSAHSSGANVYLEAAVEIDHQLYFEYTVDSTLVIQDTIAVAMRKIHIYADGACQGNPGPGGYGVVLLYGEYRKEISGGYRKTTNNRMELTAVIKGLEALKGKCEVDLYSDSKYVVDALSNGWAARWRENGWRRNKKENAVNPDLWERLLELCEEHEVTFNWVRGHSGNPENERCDLLAREAATQPNLPADNPYECNAQTAEHSKAQPDSPPGQRDPFDKTVQLIRADLHSADSHQRIRAIFSAVEQKVTELGPYIIGLMESQSEPNLRSRCAWALGRLNFREAEPKLIAALRDPSDEVRTWSAWALGEIGGARTKARLRRALAREGSENVRQAIGGALKKLSYESTRVHVSRLRKALAPPETQDPILVSLMERLQELDNSMDLEWKLKAKQISAVRAKIKNHDLAFFESYMAWVRRKPEVVVALENDRKVFHS